jgi:hypothetical protein
VTHVSSLERNSKTWPKVDLFERHLHRDRGIKHRDRGIKARNGNLEARTALIWEGRRMVAVLKFDLRMGHGALELFGDR